MSNYKSDELIISGIKFSNPLILASHKPNCFAIGTVWTDRQDIITSAGLSAGLKSKRSEYRRQAALEKEALVLQLPVRGYGHAFYHYDKDDTSHRTNEPFFFVVFISHRVIDGIVHHLLFHVHDL